VALLERFREPENYRYCDITGLSIPFSLIGFSLTGLRSSQRSLQLGEMVSRIFSD
jgi:hypothetical protein